MTELEPVGWCKECETPFYSWGFPRECEHKTLKAGFKMSVAGEVKHDQGDALFELRGSDGLREFAATQGIELDAIHHRWVQDPNQDDWLTGTENWELRTWALEKLKTE